MASHKFWSTKYSRVLSKSCTLFGLTIGSGRRGFCGGGRAGEGRFGMDLVRLGQFKLDRGVSGRVGFYCHLFPRRLLFFIIRVLHISIKSLIFQPLCRLWSYMAYVVLSNFKFYSIHSAPYARLLQLVASDAD